MTFLVIEERAQKAWLFDDPSCRVAIYETMGLTGIVTSYCSRGRTSILQHYRVIYECSRSAMKKNFTWIPTRPSVSCLCRSRKTPVLSWAASHRRRSKGRELLPGTAWLSPRCGKCWSLAEDSALQEERKVKADHIKLLLKNKKFLFVG